MAEHIKREAAVKELTRIAMGVSDTKARAVAKCINAVELLPAADVVERKRGEWMEELEIGYDGGCNGVHQRCSHCSEIFYDVDEYNFCPNCGADMRRDSDANHHH